MIQFVDIKAKTLPAMEVADALNAALNEKGAAVVTAPPGAGKSTILPLTVLNGLSDNGRILMLEPRRIAARQIAERMSAIIGEKVGETVGYKVRFESKISSSTRIEVLTEGILTKMLISDPTLEGVSVIIFDEFHERSLNSDLDLALVREIKKILRPDLKIVIMSATIDSDLICKSLGAPLIESEGKMYPVEIKYSDEIRDPLTCAETVAHIIRQAHKEYEGDILAFLPGEGEIHKCEELLGSALGETHICPLYGMLSVKEQHDAIAPSAPGERKVVLATPIAETSLTIEGVRIVIDSGFCRKMVYNSQSALSHLETVRISMDMATQRMGRAGRVAPGVCYRLWSKGQESQMAVNRTPEILDADLCSTVLEVAAWGENDMTALDWITPPPSASVYRSKNLLQLMGAVENNGRITPIGEKMSTLPCHPRISKMLLSADSPSLKSLGSDIAALIEEKDPLSQKENDSDLTSRIEELRRNRSQKSNSRVWGRILKISEQYHSLLKTKAESSIVNPFDIGKLIAEAYPERIAKAKSEGIGTFTLANGEIASVDKADNISAYDWIAIASMNSKGDASHGRIFLAAPIDTNDIEDLCRHKDNIAWDSKKRSIIAQREKRIGNLVVSSKQIDSIEKDTIIRVICEASKKEGLSMFTFDDALQNLQRRIDTVKGWKPELELPDVSNEGILMKIEEWLPLYLEKVSLSPNLEKINMCEVLWGMLTYDQQNEVDKLAPTHIKVPTGSRIKIEYRQGAEVPVLTVRLQECFGLIDTPTVNNGKTAVLMELLSPGFKPVQLTKDLRSFWNGTYFEVKKELKRRYPKHFWPDNPLEAEAVRGVKK